MQKSSGKKDLIDCSEEIVEEEESVVDSDEEDDQDMNYDDIKANKGSGAAFKLNINPDEYHFSANKYYQRYLKVKGTFFTINKIQTILGRWFILRNLLKVR